jgi:hypothetical protein
MKPLGIWVGPQDLIQLTPIVDLMLSTLHPHNLINQWLIVLKTSDLLWLIKLNKSSQEHLLSQAAIVQPHHGIHVTCVQQELKDKVWTVFVLTPMKYSLTMNVNVKLVMLKVETTVLNVLPHKLFKTENVSVQSPTKFFQTVNVIVKPDMF